MVGKWHLGKEEGDQKTVNETNVKFAQVDHNKLREIIVRCKNNKVVIAL